MDEVVNKKMMTSQKYPLPNLSFKNSKVPAICQSYIIHLIIEFLYMLRPLLRNKDQFH
jgi:hypothetical protein